MTDHDNPAADVPDEITDTTTFDTRERHRLGDRGDEHIGKRRTQTDIDRGLEIEEITVGGYSEMGAPVKSFDDTYRCHRCDALCSAAAEIEMSRRHYCPDCAETQYSLDKATYKTMYRLDSGNLEPADLINIETADGQIETVTASPVGATLLENEYIQTDAIGTQTAETAAVVDDTPLTAAGKEALHVGDQLYGDDPDVEKMQEQLHKQDVINR